ncbi:MAG: 2-hydroxychromene-2-carboxylate isomerase [Rhodobacteraceae bacterium]|nr:2-hydroxychromene-2-carboxylate isomerase [Paracoccaceae bacterium]
MPAPMHFWFEFASTYSYLSVMRIEDAAAKVGIDVVWRPFMLGPIFGAQGWRDSPFNIYPAKGAFMWRDMERRAQTYGVPFQKPPNFPQNTILAARTAQLALAQPEGRRFCKALYTAQFAEGKDLADPATIAQALATSGLPFDLIDKAQDPENKDAMKAVVTEAMELGVFGAPSFTVGSELFWGDDQLDQALSWAQSA